VELSKIGISKKELASYNKKHIYTTYDLLRWFPRKYIDYRQIKDICETQDKEYAAVKAVLEDIKIIKLRNDNAKESTNTKKKIPQKRILRLSLVCDSTTKFVVDFFVNQYSNYLARIYEKYLNRTVVVMGKVGIKPIYGYSMTETMFEFYKDFQGAIYPIYPKIGSVKDEDFRSALDYFIDMSGEVVEREIRERYGLPDFRTVLRMIHHPKTMEEIEIAKRNFVFYDLYGFNIKLNDLSSDLPSETEAVMNNAGLTNQFLSLIPYPLTQLTKEEHDHCVQTGQPGGGQREAITSMMQIMASGTRLNALVEGDVGCGKTIVATAMLMFAVGSGYQAAIVAPKTVLARQHYEEISGYCEKLGIKCVFLSNSAKKSKKVLREELLGIKNGDTQIIVGTHSCFSKGVEYARLGLIIYDEEQAFGVDQKKALYEKAVKGVHTIEMSATPIPRSLTLSIYSNKDIVRISKKPEGRVRIQTASCNNDRLTFEFMEKQMRLGRQCYVVAPAIEDNEYMGLTGVDGIAEKYRTVLEPKGFKVVVAHGRMTDDEFTESIDKFKNGEADVLVATTVIEVGVNIPNATVMVIEQAERFGLSQLHQLRGRVGRREYKSYCILMTKEKENPRILAMETMSDGFAIAEEDYKLRGPGDVTGTDQSGQNAYIEEAIAYPQIFEDAKQAAAIGLDKKMYGLFFRT